MSVPCPSLCPLLLSPQRLLSPAREEPVGPPPLWWALAFSQAQRCLSALHLPPGGFDSCWAAGSPFELVPCAGPARGCEVPATWYLSSMRGEGSKEQKDQSINKKHARQSHVGKRVTGQALLLSVCPVC